MAGRLQDTKDLFNEILRSFELDTPMPLPYSSIRLRASFHQEKTQMHSLCGFFKKA